MIKAQTSDFADMMMHSELAVEPNSEVADNFDWCDRGCTDVETEISSC